MSRQAGAAARPGTRLPGGCHCGRIRVAFETAIRPVDLHPRACDCPFCTKHGAAYVSDPEGRLRIEIEGADTLGEYRQGSGSARFLLCRCCGVLVAALFDDGVDRYGAVNARCIEGAVFGAPRTASPQTLSGEEKRTRWATLWTPRVAVSVSAG